MLTADPTEDLQLWHSFALVVSSFRLTLGDSHFRAATGTVPRLGGGLPRMQNSFPMEFEVGLFVHGKTCKRC